MSGRFGTYEMVYTASLAGSAEPQLRAAGLFLIPEPGSELFGAVQCNEAA